MTSGIRERKCRVCGKNFIAAPMHIYKSAIDGSLACSWNCVCKSKEIKKEKHTKHTKTDLI